MNNKIKLKNLLNSSNIEYAMEAYNPTSAMIAKNAGFKCLWVGSLGVSASLGIRDDSEISWSEMLSNVDNIFDYVNMPIIVDMDSGYGDENIAARVAKKLDKVGAAGACIEDKLFPKMNSFISHKQKLINVDDFCLKIKKMRDSVSKDFIIIARLEGFIVDDKIENTLNRAYKYVEAGADALVIHSKKDTVQDIREFMNKFDKRVPIIIIPTTYHREGKKVFEDLEISLVIWANHLTRASIRVMEDVAKKVYINQSVDCVENDIATMDDIFRLQNINEKDNKYGR